MNMDDTRPMPLPGDGSGRDLNQCAFLGRSMLAKE